MFEKEAESDDDRVPLAALMEATTRWRIECGEGSTFGRRRRRKEKERWGWKRNQHSIATSRSVMDDLSHLRARLSLSLSLCERARFISSLSLSCSAAIISIKNHGGV